MTTTNPDDIRFPIEEAQSIVKDLCTEAFESASGTKRSIEYQNGFRDGALERLAEGGITGTMFQPPYKEGTCEFDAWDAGHEEGDNAACAFQIVFIEDN